MLQPYRRAIDDVVALPRCVVVAVLSVVLAIVAQIAFERNLRHQALGSYATANELVEAGQNEQAVAHYRRPGECQRPKQPN